jgi:hypothetical protein
LSVIPGQLLYVEVGGNGGAFGAAGFRVIRTRRSAPTRPGCQRSRVLHRGEWGLVRRGVDLPGPGRSRDGVLDLAPLRAAGHRCAIGLASCHVQCAGGHRPGEHNERPAHPAVRHGRRSTDRSDRACGWDRAVGRDRAGGRDWRAGSCRTSGQGSADDLQTNREAREREEEDRPAVHHEAAVGTVTVKAGAAVRLLSHGRLAARGTVSRRTIVFEAVPGVKLRAGLYTLIAAQTLRRFFFLR